MSVTGRADRRAVYKQLRRHQHTIHEHRVIGRQEQIADGLAGTERSGGDADRPDRIRMRRAVEAGNVGTYISGDTLFLPGGIEIGDSAPLARSPSRARRKIAPDRRCQDNIRPAVVPPGSGHDAAIQGGSR